MVPLLAMGHRRGRSGDSLERSAVERSVDGRSVEGRDTVVLAPEPSGHRDHIIYGDTIVNAPKIATKRAKADALYDTITNHDYKKFPLIKNLARLLIRGRQGPIETQPQAQLDVSRAYFEQFAGRTITSISVVRNNVFEGERQKESKVEKFIDNLHSLVNEKEIQRNLMFRVGQTVQPYTMAVNEEWLRSMPYLSGAYIIVTPDPLDTQLVSATVITRDVWAIGAELNIGDRSYVTAYDENFFGTGNKFFMKYYAHQNGQRTGFEVAYTVRNLLGTFAKVTLELGAGATNNIARVTVDKPQILPTDFIWGGTAGHIQKFEPVPVFNKIMPVKKAEYAAWFGRAWNLESFKGTNFYAILGANHTEFPIRPTTDETMNPFYYRRTIGLMNIGISRRNFFQGNMIYGYGRTEDIPYGHKFELVGGLEWNEYLGRRPYIGASVAWGDWTKIGYVDTDLAAGTFITPQLEAQQAMVRFRLRQFSPLFDLGRHNYMREFLKITGTWGFNRLWGERELLSYDRNNEIHGLRTPFNTMGFNRLLANAEVVWFTPIFLWHFRFAFFGWADAGWMGVEKNIFANQFSAAAGIGVRIKNERLIFNNVQIRLGAIISRNPGAAYSFYQFTWEQQLQKADFTPRPPVVLPYE